MFTLDHLIVAVDDLERATAAYGALLGRAPSWRGSHPELGTRNVLFRLDTAYLELLADADGSSGGLVAAALAGATERPVGLALAAADLDAAIATLRERGIGVTDAMPGRGVDATTGATRTWRSALVSRAVPGDPWLLLIRHDPGSAPLPVSADLTADDSACHDVAALGVVASDLADADRFWVTGLGLRVAWRAGAPEERTRRVGLRLGGCTLELTEKAAGVGSPTAQRLAHVAYTVTDCARTAARLAAAGIPVVPVQAGSRSDPGVLAVQWERTPTLLVETAR